MTELQRFVEVLRAAGEATRLRLLALLAHGELSVKDITEILGQSQPRISRHLRLLAEAGLVRRHAEGAWAYFRLSDQPSGSALVTEFIGRVDPDDPVLAGDRARLEAVRAEHQQRAAAYFAKVAESWDRLRSLHVPESAVEAAIVEAVDDGPVDLCLDLGTGTGRMLELLAGRYGRGIGIDSSREMIAVARARLEGLSRRNAQARLGDIAGLDDYAGAAALIVVHQVLHYFDDPGRALKQARLALAPGGRVLVVDFAPHKFEFLRDEQAHRRLGLSNEQMAQWARGAGLEIARFRAFPSGAGDSGLTVCLWLLTDATGQQAERAA
ncbi:MAG TPA: metalloregulator ArsR/SmtB family transcription factor [Devosiaceae bacterium]|nr:metalloregulator ArsR/SmtB family transcription factor [Devosiaceae bacterium]